MNIFSQRDYVIITFIGIVILGLAELGQGKVDRWIYRIYALFFIISAILGFKLGHRYPFIDWVAICLSGVLVLFTTFGDLGGVRFRRPQKRDWQAITVIILIASAIALLFFVI